MLLQIAFPRGRVEVLCVDWMKVVHLTSRDKTTRRKLGHVPVAGIPKVVTVILTRKRIFFH
jgi:hypothetical protein